MIEIIVLASGSSGNAYKISDGTTSLLLDAGLSWKKIQQGLNFRTSELAGILITHEHNDHCKGVKDALKTGQEVYASAATWDAMSVNMAHRGRVIEARRQFKIGTWTILPFDAVHDVPCLGFLLANQTGEKLLYLTDTAYSPYRFQGLSHIMIECSFADDIIRANVDAGIVTPELKNRIIQTHFSLANIKEFFKTNDLSKVEQIFLLHLSNDNSDADRFKREIMALTGKPVYVA